MLDYDREAERYDATRGGQPRAEAAAAAYAELLTDAPAGPLLDLGCGTGSVTSALAARLDRTVVGTDLSTGMLALARPRVRHGVVCADASRLPVPDRSVAAVSLVWLLHLLSPELVRLVVVEAARVLAPGGILATTVDKGGGHARAGETASDGSAVVEALAAECGLVPARETTFVGVGQTQGQPHRQDQQPAGRPDPTYRVRSFVRSGAGRAES